MNESKELPRYLNHPTNEFGAWALKIAAVELNEDGTATIIPADSGYWIFKAGKDWVERFKSANDDLGYYVRFPKDREIWLSSGQFKRRYKPERKGWFSRVVGGLFNEAG